MFIESLHVPLTATTSPTVTVTQTTNNSGTCNIATVHQIKSEPTPSVNPSPLYLSKQGTYTHCHIRNST